MKFHAHKPNYMTGFEEPDHEFATKEELLEAPQVKRFASWATFHRFSYCENALHDNSRLTLMAELNDGYEWWVCGYAALAAAIRKSSRGQMRNLVEYPITKEEIVQAITEALEDEEKRQANDPDYGSIKEVALQEGIKCVNEYYGIKYLKGVPVKTEVWMEDGRFTQKFLDHLEITGKFDLDESID